MIGLTTGLFMLATAFTPMTLDASAIAPASTSISVSTSTETKSATTTKLALKDFKTLEAYVRAYYKDTPELAEIAKCESMFRQYDAKGAILKGVVDKDDIGIMQINKYYNGSNAEKLGYDIYTIEGNLAYAKVLYDKFGTDPWSSSEKCWEKQVVAMKQ
jgi:hypothetical protein